MLCMEDVGKRGPAMELVEQILVQGCFYYQGTPYPVQHKARFLPCPSSQS